MEETHRDPCTDWPAGGDGLWANSTTQGGTPRPAGERRRGPEQGRNLALSSPADLPFCRRTLSLPWTCANGDLTVATADPGAPNLARLRARYGPHVKLRWIARPLLRAALQARFAETLLDAAVNDLAVRHPELSARHGLTRWQAIILTLTPLAIALALHMFPADAGLVLAAMLGLGFVSNALFRLVLVWMGAARTDPAGPAQGAAESLPDYAILVPLYREAEVVADLVAAICALDYPPSRLEVMLVVEADDSGTLAALSTQPLDDRFTIVVVPPGIPRTKPKAANYALGLVSSEFTVIYDAEDRPEPDQLRKAVAAFREAPRDVACLQARLNFYNARECFLTRMFALDYSLWFDFLLPGLDRLRIPMPLGGTSNHFRTDALRRIAGWDPFNVTEDADLGIRLARLGLRVATLDSTTFEEAPVGLGNWLRQRSRWMKGYMQTWLVHMRHPIRLIAHAGPAGFAGFQLFVGGTFLTALLNPVLWAVCLWSAAFGGVSGLSFLDAPFAHVSVLGLFAGNAFFTYLAMLGPYRRGWLELTPFGFAAPLYWLLISLAAYRGLWQLVVAPWHWDKTRHGCSRQALVMPETAS